MTEPAGWNLSGDHKIWRGRHKSDSRVAGFEFDYALFCMEQKHPSHGLISASRSYGGEFYLFGSRLKHNDTITLQISEGESERSLKDDRYLDGKLLATVRLSEVQWASLICSLSTGPGVPCTLEFLAGQRFERLPPPEDSIRQHTDENKETLQKALWSLHTLSDQIGELLTGKTVSKRDLGEIKRSMDILLGNLPANLEFSHKTFEEHVDRVVAEAKASVEAHVQSVLTHLGVQAAVALPESFSPAQLPAPAPVTDIACGAQCETSCQTPAQRGVCETPATILSPSSECKEACQSDCQVVCQIAAQHDRRRK